MTIIAPSTLSADFTILGQEIKAVENGASIVRCHDVKEHVQALAVFDAMK